MDHILEPCRESTADRCRLEKLGAGCAGRDDAGLRPDGANPGNDDLGSGGKSIDAEFRRAEPKDGAQRVEGLERARELTAACPETKVAAASATRATSGSYRKRKGFGEATFASCTQSATKAPAANGRGKWNLLDLGKASVGADIALRATQESPVGYFVHESLELGWIREYLGEQDRLRVGLLP